MLRSISRLQSQPIVRSALAIGLVMLLARMAGYAEKIVLAYYFGTGYQVDVYTIVSTLITGIFVFVRELIEPGFLHTFIKADKEEGRDAAWQLFFFFAKVISVLAIVLTCIGCLFPVSVLRLLAPGLPAERLALAAGMVRLALPACFFLSLTALTNITLNAFRKFGWPAMAELIYKITILVCLVVLVGHAGIYAAGIGMLLGAALKLLVQFLQLKNRIKHPAGKIAREQVNRVWSLTWPLLAGAAFSQASVLFDNFLASYLQEGAIAALNYSRKLVDFPVSIFPYIISIVIFPYLNQLNLSQEQHRASQLLAESLAVIIVVFLPIALFCHLFPADLVALVFKRGAFQDSSVQMTAAPLRWYALGLPFFAIETVLTIYYFSHGDTRFPVFLGLGCTVLNMLLTAALVHYIGYTGIAIALVITKGIKTAILLLKLPGSFYVRKKALQHFLWKAIAGAIIFLLIVTFAGNLMIHFSRETFARRLIYLVLVFSTGTVAYTATLKFLKVKLHFN